MTDSPEYKVLVVDDNEWNRDILGRRLGRKGYDVVIAKDGHEALAAVAAEPIDLVLLDIMMPGLSGLDVLRQVRETRTEKDLPIIMATAKDGSDDMVEALELGANDYVTKPLDFPVVLARVKAQLRNKVPARLRPDVGETGGTKVVQGREIEAGMVLAEKYRIDAKIGSGNFGTVYRATHLAIQRAVAVKILQSAFETGAGSLARFRQEGVSACRIQHPNAVEVLDFGITEEGVAFLVMELLEGRALSDELKQNGPMTPERCFEVLVPVCDALAEAHSLGIVHRDIKPANIFLHEGRRDEVVKVLDFGIAKLVGDSAVEQHLTLDGGLLGTPAYMAPERVRGDAYDGRSDVYSLGTMLYLMLSDRLPFGEKDLDPITIAVKQMREKPPRLRDVAPHVPVTIEAVVMLCLEKDPRFRPDAADLAREFAMALGLPPDSRPTPGSSLRAEPPRHAPQPLAGSEARADPEEADTLADVPRPSRRVYDAPTVLEDSAHFRRPAGRDDGDSVQPADSDSESRADPD